MSGKKRVVIGETITCRKCGETRDSKVGFYWYTSHGIRYPQYQCKICVKDFKRQYGIDNKKHLSECKKEWAKRNPEKRRAAYKKYNQKDGGKRALKFNISPKGRASQCYFNSRRRASMRNAITSESKMVTKKWISDQRKEHGFKCYYCFSNQGKLTLEHVIPITRGGKHVRENIIPSCKACNDSKNNRLVSEWRPWINIPLYGLDLATA